MGRKKMFIKYSTFQSHRFRLQSAANLLISYLADFLAFLHKIYLLKRVLFLLFILSLCFYSCQKKTKPGKFVEDPDYKKGESFLFKQNDSAFYYFNKVVTGSNDSLQVAMAYNNMAAIQSDAGDYFGGQESLLKSLRFLDESKERDRYCLSSDFNELGITSFNLKNYDEALRYYDKALEFSSDKEFQLVILNNKALVYQRMGDYKEALDIYEDVARQNHNNRAAYARALSNMAKTKWLQNPDYVAASEFLTALKIRKEEEDLWGQNSSFAHLADYYTPFRPDSALCYAKSMYTVARKLNSADDQLGALRKLIKLGPSHAVKEYFAEYQTLSDSVLTARNTAKNQFALIRYEAEEHKAENLKLQKDITEKRYQILSALLLLAAVCIGFVFWYKKRKQRLELEAQNAVKENQLKLSKKVHDVVANGLYRMMSEIENEEAVDKDQLLDKIEEMYERSRDLSYERATLPDNDFHETISQLITSFATARTKVLIREQ